MSLHFTTVSLDRLDLLTRRIRTTLFWELETTPPTPSHTTDTGWEKEAWLSSVMLQWGPCVAAAEKEGHLTANAVFAPPRYVPRTRTLPAAPMSADAVALCSVDVLPGHDSLGYEIQLIDYVCRSLANRGVRAVEAFGYRCPPSGLPEEFRRRMRRDNGYLSESEALIPEEILLDAGFRVLRDHPTMPLLRKELGADLDWNAAVAEALTRLNAPRTVTLVTVIDVPHGVGVGHAHQRSDSPD